MRIVLKALSPTTFLSQKYSHKNSQEWRAMQLFNNSMVNIETAEIPR